MLNCAQPPGATPSLRAGRRPGAGVRTVSSCCGLRTKMATTICDQRRGAGGGALSAPAKRLVASWHSPARKRGAAGLAQVMRGSRWPAAPAQTLETRRLGPGRDTPHPGARLSRAELRKSERGWGFVKLQTYQHDHTPEDGRQREAPAKVPEDGHRGHGSGTVARTGTPHLLTRGSPHRKRALRSD